MGRLVLVADADAQRAERIAEACSTRGYATQAVSNGAEALEAALHSVPDVLVSDAALKVIEAPKVAEILRANPRTHNVQFVLFGVSSVAEDAPPGLRIPGDHPDEIAERVEELLARDAAFDPAASAPSEPEEEVRGHVAQIPLPDLLQLFHLNRRSGIVELGRRTPEGREERGRIYLREGDVIQAAVGAVEGEKALFRLLGWSEGSFAFRSERVRLAARVQTPTRALLLEGMRQLDEWKRAAATLPSREAQVSLRVTSAELPNVVHPLTQEVLLLLEIYTRVGDVVDQCTFPDYQVLRTLQTLEARGIVEIRSGPAPPPPDAGLFTEHQIRRLREWLAPAAPDPGPLRDAKLLILSADREATRELVRLLARLPGMRLAPEVRAGRFPAEPVAVLGRLRVDDELGIEFLHVPADESHAALWPLAGYRALGVFALLHGPIAAAQAELRPALQVLRDLPRSRIFHVVLLRKGEEGLPDAIRDNVSLLDEGSLFLLPLEDGRDPVAILRSIFSRVLP